MTMGEYKTQVYYNMFNGFWGIRLIRFGTDEAGAGTSEIARSEDLPVTWLARASFFVGEQ